jgi:hypothetical protein
MRRICSFFYTLITLFVHHLQAIVNVVSNVSLRILILDILYSHLPFPYRL